MFLTIILAVITGLPPITRDLTGADPGSWEDWVAGEPEPVPFSVKPLFSCSCDDGIDFAVLMEEGLADSLTPGTIERWALDMAPWVGGVLVAEASYSTPEEIRAWLSEMHGQGLDGVVLVGDLPVAWVMMDNAFTRSSETFPCDYFLMDLDGLWEDRWIGYPSAGRPGQDGKYDTWGTSGLAPEIYCARIMPSKIGAEVSLLQAYLDRNHLWRTEGDPLPFQTLCYVDDDWVPFSAEFRDAMRRLYPLVELVSDPQQTCGTDYKENRLTAVYQWISPFVHSSPLLHQWSPGPDTYWKEVKAIDPQARFYNLFACSNCRFTTPNNMGSIYVLGTSYGLAAVGSTKTGSMLRFEPFYQTLGEGGCLGEAYFDWWTAITAGGFSSYEMSWHLGMVMIGDPTLVPAAPMLGLPDDWIASPEPAVMTILENPCVSSVRVGLADGASGVRILDASGRVVASNPAARGGDTVEFDMRGLPSGIYTAVTESPAGVAAVRFARL